MSGKSSNDGNEKWKGLMQPSPFRQERFTEELAQAVNRRIHAESAERARTGWRSPAILAVMLTMLGLAGAWGLLYPGGDQSGAGARAENHVYVEQGKQLFAIYPEPEARAGSMQGYLFSFAAPFSVFEGKRLTVEAVHSDSGWRENASSEIILNPDSGYAGLERHGMRFALPLGGLWRLDVLLDGVSYGYVTIALREPDWQVSPEFSSGSYLMRGVEGKVGFIDAGFRAGMPQKYMWHFWGDQGELDGDQEFQVLAVRKGEEKPIEVFKGELFSGSLNGADRAAASMMTLPDPGLWRLLPYLNGSLLDSIVVDVK